MELSLRLQQREIRLQEGVPEEHHYASNRVTTGVDTLLGCIAAIAGHQATRLVSWWFVIVAIVAMNPLGLDYAPTPLPLALLLLYFALVLARETVAVWHRRAVDKEFNEEVTSVWTGQDYEQMAFHKVQVGHCVLVREGERFPADVVLLATSQKNGTCVVTTANILGENDSSVKAASKELQRILPTEDSPLAFNFSRLNVILRIDPPSSDYHSFQGKLTIKTLPRACVLSLSHLVLRGSVLHSKWALGLVVYTGMETKIWLDRSLPARKLSMFSRAMNVWTAATALVVLGVTGLMVLLQRYVSVEEVRGEDVLLYFLCFSGTIPVAISLGLNITRVLLLWRYRREIPGIVFKSGTFSEDLADVRYVLMDKTGTVTTNQLEVTQIIIDDSTYIRCEDKPQSTPIDSSNRLETLRFSCSTREKSDSSFRDLQEKMRLGQDVSVRRLCEAMTMCNDVDPAESSVNGEELAMIEAAKELGCVGSRGEEECEMEVLNSTVRYRVLAMRKFSPELGRVRILIQEESDLEAILYVKGTYPAVKDLLELPSEERIRLELRLEEMIRSGMRPVVFCYRAFSGEVLDVVRARAQSARISQLNSEGKTEILLKEIEKDLSFLAIVGLTDKVAGEVKDCVQLLDLCGVETWLLSGDTETNTLACAYSLGLLRPTVKLVQLKKVSPELCGRKLLSVAKDHVFTKHGLPYFPAETPRSYFENAAFLNWSEATPDTFEFALSIDGITLSGALQDHANRRLLACLLYAASFVCFNRLLPSHKRKLAKLLKHGLGARPIVLGIGDDGGNVAMLLEADIGVGVLNQQDSRAVNTSDLAIPACAVLGRVLLAARENYELLSKVALLFIYSTTLLHFCQFAYVLVACVTPTAVFPLELTVYYNTLLCLFLFVGFGLTHRSHCTPEQYGLKRKIGFTWQGVRKYLLLTLGHTCMLLALLSLALLSASSLACEEVTVTVLLAVVLTVNQHCWQEANSWLFLPFPLLSIGAAFAYCGGDAGLSPALAHVFCQPCLVLAIFLSPLACIPLSSLLLTPYLLRRRSNAVMPVTTQSSFMRRLQRESKVILELYHASKTTSAPETAEGTNYEIEPVVKFRSRETEEEYITYFLLSSMSLIRFALLLLILQLCLAIRREAVQHTADIPFLSLALVGAVGLLGASWLPWPFLTLMQAYSALFLVLTFVLDMLTATVRGIAYSLVPIGLLLIAKEHWISNISIVSLSSLLICVDSAVRLVCSNRYWEDIEEIIGTLVVYAMISIIAAVAAYRSNYSSRTRFQLCKETEKRMVQNENILSFLLPDFVRRQVKDGFRYIAEDKDSVSVLFCEICHFDSIVATYSPADLTELLDDVFHQIDELCVTLGVAKIETVGKVYMACTGLSDFESELASELQAVPHTQRALELAFAIINSFKNYRLQTGASLQVKIGIHTGPVIAGVVGYTKPQFSLVGDTVNTASRMSSTAPGPNTIQVSEATFQDLKGTATMCDFTMKTLLVKGKGEQTTYLAREVAGVPKTRRRAGSEDAATLIRGKYRHRSSIVTSLRESLEIQEAFAKDEQKLREHMLWLPCAPVSLMEEQFRKDSATRHMQDLRLGLYMYILGLALRLAIEFRLDTAVAIVPGLLFTLALVVCVCVQVRLEQWSERKWLPWCLIGIYVVVGLGLCAEHWLANLPMLTTLEIVLTLVLMHYCSGLLFRHILLGSVLVLVPWIGVCIAREPDTWEYPLFSLLFAIQHCIHKYFDEQNERLLFSLSELASSEIEKTERLLAHMLPGHAYESLKQEEWVSDRLSRVTLLFADVSGFTPWAAVHTPQEVVTYLSTIYASFDKECTRLGLYKVHTIGDCYVAMSATNNNDLRDPGEECKRMLSLAQAMIEELKDQTEGINMRIGLHCGDVIACITGSQVIRYDIYGNDVLIANRAESCGLPGRINVSEDVKSLMESDYPGSFSFVPNRELRIEEFQRSLQSFFLASV